MGDLIMGLLAKVLMFLLGICIMEVARENESRGYFLLGWVWSEFWTVEMTIYIIKYFVS